MSDEELLFWARSEGPGKWQARYILADNERQRLEADLARIKKQRAYVAEILGGITMESTEGGDNVDRLADLTRAEFERLRGQIEERRNNAIERGER